MTRLRLVARLPEFRDLRTVSGGFILLGDGIAVAAQIAD